MPARNVVLYGFAFATAALGASSVPAPTAEAAARRAERLLTVHAISVGSTSAPLVVRVAVPRHATLRAWVDGRRADGAFHRTAPHRRRAQLTAHDGLHPGRNTIRLVAILPDGTRDVETRTVRIRRPIVDAGHDTVTLAGRRVAVGLPKAAVTGLRGRTPLRWRIAAEPRGSEARLDDATTTTPDLVTEQPGTYVLRLTAGTGDDVAHDTLTVTARPDDPPIGVPLQTLSDSPAGAVWIDGRPVRDVTNRDGIFVVVLERRTRAVVEAGTTPRHGGGINQLRQIAANWGGSDRYLMIVSSAQGVTSDTDRNALRALFGALGAPKPGDAQIEAIASGTPFSVVGIAGGVEGSAWTKLPPRGAPVAAANLTGNLQLNQASVGTTPKHYDVVSLDHPTFDTRRESSAGKTNTIRWNGRDYTATLPSYATDGLHAMVIDPYTGAVREHNPLTTNGDNTDRQVEIAADWLRIKLDEQPAPLVLMQSIGHPSGRTKNWNRLIDQMARLGANRYVVNALDGTTDAYALAGRPGSAAPAAEASSATGEPGELTGVTTPDRTMQLTPVAADPFGDLNTELVEVAYQPPRAFPAFDTPGKQAAEGFIGGSLGFCARDARACDMRRRYYENYESANWNQKSIDLDRLTHPRTATDFTDDDFRAVKNQLADELSAVSNVQHYFATLQSPFDRTAGKSILDLNDVADNLRNEFATPTGDAATSWALGLVSQLAAVGGAIESEVSGGLSAMSAVFSLVSYLTEENGTSVLGTEIQSKASQLGHELYDRYDVAQQATTGIALLFVSDWGKLQVAASKLDNDWRLPATMAGASANLKLSAKRWFAESLVPTAFPYLLRATPRPVGSGTAIGTECRRYDGWGQHWFLTHPWNQIDGRTQVQVTEAINDDGSRRLTTLWPTRDFETYPKSGNVATLLFNATDARTAGLGLDRLAFFAPANFRGDRVWSANDRANNCDLPFK